MRSGTDERERALMSYLLSIAETCGLNILLALSVYATFMVGQFSLAQVGFWSIGAYARLSDQRPDWFAG